MEGCGRCELAGTPRCKVHRWQEELALLRIIVLDCGLTEELKWGVACYTNGKKNIVIIHAFKEYCGLTFIKGALLKDPKGILTQATENTQAGRQIRITKTEEIVKLGSEIKCFIQEALEIEDSGLKVQSKDISEYEIPEELQARFEEDANLLAAFRALTPGRQRAYLLFFAQAKQSKTREARIDKYIPQIMVGKGLNE